MKNFQKKYNFTEEEWESTLKVLETLKTNPLNNPDNQRFGALVTKIHKLAKKELKSCRVEPSEKKEKEPKRVERKSNKALNKEHDLNLVKGSTIIKNALAKTSYFNSRVYSFVKSFLF